MVSPLAGSNVDAERATSILVGGFQDYRHLTAQISRRARMRFERRDWNGLHQDGLDRLDVFPQAVVGVLAALASLDGGAARRELWMHVREAVRAWLSDRPDADLGATFYNSVVRRALGTIGADPLTEFAGGLEDRRAGPGLSVRYPVDVSMRTTVRRMFMDLRWSADWRNLPEDARAAADCIDEQWGHDAAPAHSVDVLPHLFYRGTRAFLVGRVVADARHLPIAIAFRHEADGISADAVLHTEDAVSILFSFTRAYFHVDDHEPAAMVHFLGEIMPRKPRNELYTALGFHKHGKTLLYRDIARHIATSEDRFVRAPGTKGMVMATFMLPGVGVVFKVIRDQFAPPKTTTRREVMERYNLVFKHDRAGRLVDAQEFEHLAFPRERFADDLLDELRGSCASQLHEYADTIEIRHLYTERRLTPLDLYLARTDRASAVDAILDWGQSIKDLAATNIFPGDLLLKNFGVTRHRRVVFYDYDELCPLSACRFRRMPQARHDEDEYSAEPWFHVNENDIFPEEFLTFLGLPPTLTPVFLAAHGDLFGIEFWQAMQARHAAGEVIDILPYRESDRLRPSNDLL